MKNYDQDVTSEGKVRLRAELASNALAQYGMEDAKVSLIRSRGDSTLVFRVSSGAEEDHLLKMYLPPRSERKLLSRSEAALRSQLLWQSALRHEAGLPVQEPVLTSAGEFAAHASAEGSPESRIAVLMSWVPGEQKAPEDLTPKELRMMGAHTARLHRHAEGFTPPKGFVRPRWDWNSTFVATRPIWSRGRTFYTIGEMEMFRAAAEYVRQDLQKLGEESEVFGLIHRDIQAKNLVFDGEQVHAIDFESCGWGYYLFDLALISLRLESHEEHHDALHEALFEGYRQVRTLPEHYEQYLETFAVMRMVERINVLLRRAEPVSHHMAHTYFPAAARRVEKFVESKRNRGVRKFFPARARNALGKLKAGISSRRTVL